MKILVLAGTAEARDLCVALKGEGHDVIASLAGATRKPMPIGVPTRVGGFGGVVGLQDYIDTNQIETLIDATHPFARQITRNAAAVSVRNHIILQRPAWGAEEGDRWTEISEPSEACAYVGQDQVVFLATGRQTINEFNCLNHAYVYARVIDVPDKSYPYRGEYLQGRPPFSVEDEIALFERLSVDWLIVKNAGGKNSITKLEAARRLGIPVLMIKRPALPDVEMRKNIGAVLEWVNGLK